VRAACILVIGTVALAGCGSGSPKYDELVVQTIEGMLDPFNTAPIEGVHVQVNNQPWATTDANGKATFKNVVRPFTVRSTYPLLPGGDTHVVWNGVGETQGLDANPAVIVINRYHASTRQVSIAGSVANRSADAGSVTRVSAGAPIYADPVQVAADGTFQIQGTWDRLLSPTQTIVLHALESNTADPFPTQYSRYGSASVSVTDGTPVNGVMVQLGPVAQTQISGNVTMTGAPAGTVLAVSLLLVFPNNSLINLANHDGEHPAVPGPFDYTVPIAGTQTAEIHFYGGGQVGQGSHSRHVAIADGTPVGGLAFDIPALVTLVEPADGATIGTDTVFRWTMGPPGVTYYLSVVCRNGQIRDVETDWKILTPSTEARLFSTPFITLVPGMTCFWGVDWNDGDLSAPQGARGADTGPRSAVLR
jgi:hypothetical protein